MLYTATRDAWVAFAEAHKDISAPPSIRAEALRSYAQTLDDAMGKVIREGFLQYEEGLINAQELALRISCMMQQPIE